MLITRALIVVMVLWLPLQGIEAASMALCQHAPQGDTTASVAAHGSSNCNLADSDTPPVCKLCHACILCPTPALSDNHLLSFSQLPGFEPAAVWQPYVRSLDVLEHPPRPVLPLSS